MNDNSPNMSNAETERLTGRSLNDRWSVHASHALYREDGDWYHRLRRFPGALFDREGYILFDTENDFRACPGVRVYDEKNQVAVKGGIRTLPGYVRKSELIIDDADTGDTPEDDEGPRNYANVIGEIDIREDNHSVFEWVRKLERGLIRTDPDFQRNVVWKPGQKSRFIESILLNVPIPPIYVNQDVSGEYVLVDGLQRTTTLQHFVNDKFPLSGLQILWGLENQRFSQLESRLQTRIEDRKLFVFVIKPSVPMSAVYDIFYRINSGGTQLNRQEIRNCLFAGASTRLLKQLAESQEFLQATDHGFSPTRMKDREAVLRCIAFSEFDYEKDYRGDMDDFLKMVMEQINDKKTDGSWLGKTERAFSRVMQITFAVFGRNNFRPTSDDGRGRINVALMEAVYRFFAAHIRDTSLRAKKERLSSNYRRLCGDPGFVDSIQRSTGDRQRVLTRFRLADEILGDL
jgi:hypothetical protein